MGLFLERSAPDESRTTLLQRCTTDASTAEVYRQKLFINSISEEKPRLFTNWENGMVLEANVDGPTECSMQISCGTMLINKVVVVFCPTFVPRAKKVNARVLRAVCVSWL
jgi:hypothetical protein